METKGTDLKDDLLITTVPTCIQSKGKLRQTCLIMLAPEQSQLIWDVNTLLLWKTYVPWQLLWFAGSDLLFRKFIHRKDVTTRENDSNTLF